MRAVWRVARAAIRRRRLQTAVIGLVVAVSTGMMVLALGLTVSAAAPFDRAHALQSGADLVLAFDASLVSDEQLTRAAAVPETEAVAGPFGQVTLDVSPGTGLLPRALTIVGRADPGGPVERLEVWQGRWATEPGEIVLNGAPGATDGVLLGTRIAVPGSAGLVVVGLATSVTETAGGWVTPEQVAALRPSAAQMLYRFTDAATAENIHTGQSAVTAGLPPGSVLGSQSYLTIKQRLTSESGIFIPFLLVFGVLGLTVAVLIVANVVSGAVVSGLRDIGVLKALGFTPNQVLAVYLVTVCLPAVAGCATGIVAGNLVGPAILGDAFQLLGGRFVIDPWVDAVAVLAMPAVIGLAALASALRARRMPPAQAISAGSPTQAGRARRIQRWLSGTRLPRSVSLGLGLPLARLARSALTLAAVVLGVTTVTLAIGVTASAGAYDAAVRPSYPDRVEVLAGRFGAQAAGGLDTGGAQLSDAEDEALLRGIAGTVRFAAIARWEVTLVGGQLGATVNFYRGDDAASLGPRVTTGRWPAAAGEVAVPSRFLNQRGLALGDTITMELDGGRTRVQIVGLVLTNNADTIFADWSTLDLLSPGTRADRYVVQLAPGADRESFVDAMLEGDPGLEALPPRDGVSDVRLALVGSATLLTLVLAAVAALGVFNTVVLNAHERRRDVGMLKSIGMTPRQVTVMLVTSMGALGVAGGLIGVPLGVAAHRLVTPAMMRAAQSDVLDVVLNVYQVPVLMALVLAGLVIAVLGALLPARSAARTPIAAVLHSE